MYYGTIESRHMGTSQKKKTLHDPPQYGTPVIGLQSPLGPDKVLQDLSLRVQVHNNHILAQDLYYNNYYPKPKYLIIGYMDP